MALITGKVTLTPTATGSAPSGAEGDLYYDSTESSLMSYTDSVGATASWRKISGASATGGAMTEYNGYKMHAFTGSGNFVVVNGSLVCDIMIVAGGGGSGLHHSAGAGAGGLLYGQVTVTVGSWAIVVGAGGAGAPSLTNNVKGSNGSNSTMVLPSGTATANGGGWGGTRQDAGGAGGSGGGTKYTYGGANSGGTGNQGNSQGLTGYGNNGGYGYAGHSVPHYSAGGGGGAGAVGESGGGNDRSYDGGIGKDMSAYFGTLYGEDGWFAGGGGGGAHEGNGGAEHRHPWRGMAGKGGGGIGGIDGGEQYPGEAGAPNTGGGAGPNERQQDPQARPYSFTGGSGIVIIRYATT